MYYPVEVTMDTEMKQNLKNTNTWLRMLFMILFAIFFGAALNIFGIIVLFQLILSLFTGKTNARVRKFSNQMSKYIYSIMDYLSYNSEERPFPFADWPEADVVEVETVPEPVDSGDNKE